MSTTQRVWISADARDRLRRELATLSELCAAAPDEPADENAVAVTRARRSRIQRIHDLLLNAVVGEDPPDDGVAEPGMVVTVRFGDTAETETFLLGVRGAEHGDLEVYSVHSPLGAAIVGARPGERRTYRLPNGSDLAVTMVTAVPHGLHAGRVALEMPNR
ncbi:transcription elongation factor GreAB [Mycolicibacterium sp. P1-18]|uniref:GreA/GreB family elongation factor n=1 Tax=Mycolicibacterium sp. P1-18 TaxID=2024615 RepID=UPI0011F13D54|nr:GreA/GreB family elongation factor [Mycolicibacterium sp. P1-18]KAA0094102.1 transcription elongation factor GreAB [Mycolicibacterium sp. P1-18]